MSHLVAKMGIWKRSFPSRSKIPAVRQPDVVRRLRLTPVSRLDEETRRIGRAGLANARATLAASRRPHDLLVREPPPGQPLTDGARR